MKLFQTFITLQAHIDDISQIQVSQEISSTLRIGTTPSIISWRRKLCSSIPVICCTADGIRSKTITIEKFKYYYYRVIPDYAKHHMIMLSHDII